RACTAFSYVSFTITSSQLETQLVTDNSPPRRQARRDLNPHPPDLESGALTVRATGLYALPLLLPYSSPRFPVRGMLTTKPTILLKFEPVRSSTLVFRGCVVTALAFITR